MSDAPRQEPAGSDLTTRFAAAVVMIAVACIATYAGGWPFRLLVFAGAGAMLVEWGDMHRVGRLWTWIGVALLAVPILILSQYFFPAADAQPDALDIDALAPLWIALAVTAAIGLVCGAISRRLALGWGYLYVAIPAFALVLLNWAWFELVFWLMLVTWATDIFAYFAGRGLGGPKLAPRISPNKTWSGLIGGMAGAAVVGALAAWLLDIGPPFLFLGAPMGLIAQLGDLYESWVKRRAGVKDSGGLIPGHGGVLDRLDGLLPVVVATLLILVATLGSA
ncbi:MAG: phosphatidate cytidylyltransferase [Sphingomonadales bacterium]|jgi:phosphatidate cytidylyltransferase|nr:phosphatidate cytidylyltransferase [Sphingomonadales bacterium]